MRLLRALVCLVLALTLVGAPVAHARIFGIMPVTDSHHGHHAAAAVTHDAAHDCDHPAQGSLQDARGCQTACCFMPAQLPVRTGAPTAMEFRRISYPVAALVLTGRARAPDPEIPKHT